jgi:hypothetical protein
MPANGYAVTGISCPEFSPVIPPEFGTVFEGVLRYSCPRKGCLRGDMIELLGTKNKKQQITV